MRLVGQKSDIVLALFVISVASMLLVPLPTVLLDLLLVLNIAFSLLLLLVALYMPSALSLLSFPAVLLLSTLFRLGLNVASTRLILSQGQAGQVINAFGNFLIRGEVVVGVIIFTIITIVNFIVIARGATRVSEVAARFSLDALPGKQMAIDSDVRAGLITAQEAQRRREDLRKESQLYGSMDGAMKFVQGDAIAGFFIILTNIIGGLYLGLSRGQGFADAVQTYTTLTVGDGLVSQIPALLISICAGIVVTRVSSGENATLGSDLGTQLFAQPATLSVAGTLVFLIGLLPGLPVLPFTAIAVVFFGLAFFVRRQAVAKNPVFPLREQLGASPLLPAPGDDEVFEKEPITLALDSNGLFRQYRNSQQRYRAYWTQFVSGFAAQSGVLLPELRVVSDEHLRPFSFEVVLNGITLDALELAPDWVMAEINPESAHALGVAVEGECAHPLDGSRLSWASNNALLQRLSEVASVRCFDQIEFSFLKIAALVRAYPEQFISLAEIHAGLKAVEKRNQGLLADSINKDFITVPRFTEICYALIREGLSIRDLRHVVEVVAQYCSSVGKEYVEDGIFDIAHIISFFRIAKKKQLLAPFIQRDNSLRVITLSNEIEDLFDPSSKAGVSQGDQFEAIAGSLQSLVNPIIKRGVMPFCFICRGETRNAVAAYLNEQLTFPGVFSFEELDSRVKLQQVGVWAL